MPYQRIVLPNTYVGEPGPLPPELVGLSDDSLADLSAALSPEACEELGYAGVGFLWVEPVPTLGELKDAKLAQVEAANLSHKTAPFPWDFGAIHAKDDNGDDVGPAGAQTLQVRDIEDEKNWLAAQALAAAAVVAGAGSVVVPMKCTANLWIQVTAAQAIQVLTLGDGAQLPLVQRQAAVLRRYGELKRAVADAADAEALDDVDVNNGWPA